MPNNKYFYTTQGIEPDRTVIYNNKQISLLKGQIIAPVPSFEELNQTLEQYAILQKKYKSLKNKASIFSPILKKWIKEKLES